MISVIICTYNRDSYIYKTLEFVAINDLSTEEYEILLIDNNCTDNTVAECERFQKSFPNVRYRYFLETKQGLSYARNRGIAEAHGDCFVFLDDDAFVEFNYLRNLRLYLSQYPEMMAYGGKIIPLYETGYEPDWMSPWLVPIVSAIDKSPDIVPFTGKSYPIGANMGFRRSCIEKVGLFNTTLGRTKKNLIGGEEKDIFNRVQLQNMQVLYFPNLIVHHVIPESRTTMTYVRNMAVGVGQSEKIRCSSCVKEYLAVILKELIKWGGSIVLALYYFLLGKPLKSKALLVFRWNVTKGLLQ